MKKIYPGLKYNYLFSNHFFGKETSPLKLDGEVIEVKANLENKKMVKHKLLWRWNAPLNSIVGDEYVEYITPYKEFIKNVIWLK